MFSSNIIDRTQWTHQALADLIGLNFINIYVVGVAVLLLAAWRLKEWI